jgi:hypothetical protein
MISLVEVERRLAAVPGMNGRPVVQRLDPKKDGGLFVQVTVDGADCWFRCHGDDCEPVPPEKDRRLPLARELPVLRESGDVRVLAYRPERRIVLLVEDADGARVLKGYRSTHVAACVRSHERAYAALEDSAACPPELLSVDESLGCFTMGFQRGRMLSLSSRHEDAYFRIGAALRALQLGSVDGLPRHGIPEELGVLDGLLIKAHRAGVVTPPSWPELRRRTGEAAAGSGQVAHGLAHRDLHDGQFIECADGLVVFDFDMLCVADPLLDAANLIAHLKLREMQGLHDVDERTVPICGRQLLDGLDRDDEPLFRERLRFYQATTFLRLSLVYAMRRRWAHLSQDLLEHARRCVDDR